MLAWHIFSWLIVATTLGLSSNVARGFYITKRSPYKRRPQFVVPRVVNTDLYVIRGDDHTGLI